MNRAALIASLLAAATIAATATLLVAGPLTPPSGPVASTYKTLSEVEPRIAINLANTPGDPAGDPSPSLFKITQPGSYYLTGNITGVAGKHGIEIVSSGVTLDLNGFDLAGIPAMGAFDGVTVTVSGLQSITVRNGSVRGWGAEGVDLGAVSVTNSRIDAIVASGNVGNGIRVNSATTVSNCVASANMIRGIQTSWGCTVSNCVAYQNTTEGILASTGSTISNCTVYDNGTLGINAGGGCVVSHCAAYSNGVDGIRVFTVCTVTACTASNNGENGYNLSNGSTISDCTATSNGLDGIFASSSCLIRGNNCAFNGTTGTGAGIHVTSGDNRIDANSCVSNDLGIDVDSVGNIIIRNTCSGNTTNFSFVAGNAYGPIVDTPSGPAVSGNTAAAALGSTDPNANFTF